MINRQGKRGHPEVKTFRKVDRSCDHCARRLHPSSSRERIPFKDKCQVAKSANSYLLEALSCIGCCTGYIARDNEFTILKYLAVVPFKLEGEDSYVKGLKYDIQAAQLECGMPPVTHPHVSHGKYIRDLVLVGSTKRSQTAAKL